MEKSDAVKNFGSVAKLARAVGVTSSAVSQWPRTLPPRIADRVMAAMFRAGMTPHKGTQRQ
ncbi:MAG: hypothetical protein IJS87_06515 [Rhodocyclaceae bacterium]|nr:hypothetical protein [Rhodocyclaceae bacterium]